MSDETDARLLGALNDLLVEVMRLRADIAALRTGATTQPIDDGIRSGLFPRSRRTLLGPTRVVSTSAADNLTLAVVEPRDRQPNDRRLGEESTRQHTPGKLRG